MEMYIWPDGPRKCSTSLANSSLWSGSGVGYRAFFLELPSGTVDDQSLTPFLRYVLGGRRVLQLKGEVTAME
jgi:hypothetical protein